MTTTLNASTAGAGGFIATGDNSGVLALQTAGTTALTVATNGSIGIGTTSPNDVLEVAGNDAYIRVNRTGNEPGILLTYSNSSTNRGNIAVTSGGAMYFTSGGNTERMRIDSSGRLLIGTTSNTVANGGIVADVAAAGGMDFVVGHASGTASGSNYIEFRYNNGTIGSITQNGTTAVSFNTSSDYRLKENIAPMTSALAKVAQLKPVTYTWKSAPDETGEGFIAHELAEVCPQAVHGTKDAVDANGNPVYQGIDTSFLVATLTAAIQELKAINDTQAETINALTARVVALESK